MPQYADVVLFLDDDCDDIAVQQPVVEPDPLAGVLGRVAPDPRIAEFPAEVLVARRVALPVTCP
jgi:hypothetical protein